MHSALLPALVWPTVHSPGVPAKWYLTPGWLDTAQHIKLAMMLCLFTAPSCAHDV